MLYQAFDMLYGVDTGPQISATYVDAKYPGTRALQDKTFKTLAMLAYTGCHTGVHFGMLNGGGSISPVQMMLDFELNHQLERLTEDLQVTEESLQLAEMLRLGPKVISSKAITRLIIIITIYFITAMQMIRRKTA
jgi:trimethylamine:corrinoid methyltransferase-like protein